MVPMMPITLQQLVPAAQLMQGAIGLIVGLYALMFMAVLARHVQRRQRTARYVRL